MKTKGSYEYKLWDKVVITKGRLKHETGTAIGERTDANWNHMIQVNRDNPKARDRCVQIPRSWLEAIPKEKSK
ncbi:hypothetical protein KAR91_37705 [Candidatus Pacearchaeota archaeon]|nr:hypothetical protein [Candidatus Pacearchaeota archaeon]